MVLEEIVINALSDRRIAETISLGTELDSPVLFAEE
jgi:hypothetical protein